MALLDEDASGCLAIGVEAGSWLAVVCIDLVKQRCF
jgi:hypothetical protein